MINECVIVSTEIDDKFILAKNRDRAYKPVLEIVHTILNDVEVAYLHDITTDWSEGMNEYGIGIINSALLVGRDEIEKKIVKKTGKKSEDGKKIRNAISKKTLPDAVKAAIGYKDDSASTIRGHTFVGSPKHIISIEATSKHKPVVKLQNAEHPIVRTNHGFIFHDAGYTQGINYKSSKIRKLSAEKAVKSVKDWTKIGDALQKQYYSKHSMLNMKRDTDKMFTSSQTIMNLTDKVLMVDYFDDKVEKFEGIKTDLPKGYEPKIKIIVNKL
jgi:hypothetical protein